MINNPMNGNDIGGRINPDGERRSVALSRAWPAPKKDNFHRMRFFFVSFVSFVVRIP
jgi:hypothetical protein